MKIFLNREPVAGPWGGGTKLVTALIDRLKHDGHDVVHTLDNPCDVYVCFDPRPDKYGMDASHILGARHAVGGRFVCRVGDVGTHGKLQLTRVWTGVLQHADAIVFPSMWARDYLISWTHENLPYLANGTEVKLLSSATHIVPNGALEVFHNCRRKAGKVEEPIRVVSSHWSNNPLKGFDVYKAIDDDLSFEFTYVGRCPPNMKFKNYIAPLAAEDLADELSRHDVYITASKWEAGANHVLEAMAVGLPVAYSREGGSIVEYCNGYGVMYDGTCENARLAIQQCALNVEKYTQSYMRVTERDVVDEYMEVILA